MLTAGVGVGLLLLDFVRTRRRLRARPRPSEPKQELVDHDRRVFAALDEILSEKQLEHLLGERLGLGWAYLDELDHLHKFCLEAQRIENQFLVPDVAQTGEHAIATLNRIRECTLQHFFTVDSGDPNRDRVKFHPDLIDKDVYDQYWNELQSCVDAGWVGYRQFRKTVKDILHT